MEDPPFSQAGGKAQRAVPCKCAYFKDPLRPEQTADHFKEFALKMPAEHMGLGMVGISMIGDLVQQDSLPGRIPFCICMGQWAYNVHSCNFATKISILTAPHSSTKN